MLIQWGMNKMAEIIQTKFSKCVFWEFLLAVWLKMHGNVSLYARLTINYTCSWFRQWLGVEQSITRNNWSLNQWGPIPLMYIYIIRHQYVKTFTWHHEKCTLSSTMTLLVEIDCVLKDATTFLLNNLILAIATLSVYVSSSSIHSLLVVLLSIPMWSHSVL